MKKVLLALLPFWTPLIPPQGMAYLKSFMQKYGYVVKTIDLNVESEFNNIYMRYFGALREYIPEHRWGNFYNIGHDVLRNHMMAHINFVSEDEYLESVRIFIYQTFFYKLSNYQIIQLNKILEEFYSRLERRFLDLLDKEKPDVLGLTTNIGTLAASMFAFKLTKEKYPQVLTVMGGSVFYGELNIDSPEFQLFLEKTPYIDKIVVGEGENLFLKLLQGELPESQKIYTIRDINKETLDLSEIDIPDQSDFDLSKYFYLSSFASVGCPLHCSFCNVERFLGKFRKRDVKQTVEHMLRISQTGRSQLFFMIDALLNPVLDDLSVELMKTEIPIYYIGYLLVENSVCNIENTIRWRRGGLYRARLGIESGSQRVLDLMKKKITPEKTRAAVSALAAAGIKTTVYCVIGYPGETEEDFQQTLALIGDLKNDIWQAECNPFYYFYSGQNSSNDWELLRKPLYPDKIAEQLITQTWILDCKPTREVRFQRVFRFVEHCKKLGIPNPYTVYDIYKADERWKRLHENSVPSMIEFKNSNKYINERKKAVRIFSVQDTIRDHGDFCF